MRKNTLCNAIIAALAGVSGLANVCNAVNLTPDGLGQVLLYPYYSINQGSTLLSLGAGPAVKVRFLEARNRHTVLDFNLYLTPYDMLAHALFSAPLYDALDPLPPTHPTFDDSVQVFTLTRGEDLDWPVIDRMPEHVPGYLRCLPERTQREALKTSGRPHTAKVGGYRPGTSGPRRTAG